LYAIEAEILSKPVTIPCLRKKLCKFLFVRRSPNFHQFW